MTKTATLTTGSTRRSLELQPKTAERLDRLREVLEASSDTEVFRRALQTLEGVVEDERRGNRFYMKDAATGETVLIRFTTQS